MSDLTAQPEKAFSLTPQSLDEALKFADILAKSSIVPKDFAGNPGNILVAIQWGLELGLQPMQAMQNIAVINGRPSLWGDAVIALVRSSPACEYIYETVENGMATCRVKRRGEEEQTRTFSMAQAKQAGLQGKSGPWTQYPERMLQLRARAFAVRDVFPDVLKGMPVAEEVRDHEQHDYKPAQRAGRPSPTQIAHQKQEEQQPDMSETVGFLEDVATAEGTDAFKAAWKNLSDKDKGAIGIAERNRIHVMAQEAQTDE